MAYIAVLQRDARIAARLTAALDDIHRVRMVESWEGLESLVSTSAVHACVVDADQPDREEAVEKIRRLGGIDPRVAIVAYGNLQGEAHELYRFGSLGVHAVVAAGESPHAAGLQTAVDRAMDATQASRLRETLDGRFPPLGVEALAWATEHGRQEPDVGALASALGHTRRSLREALRRLDLPTPTQILVWGRLLLAGARLGRDGYTVEETAYLLGYSTANALARAMKRETGRTPTQVAAEGGASAVEEALFASPTNSGSSPGRSVRGTILAALMVGQAGCAGLGLAGGPVDGDAVDRVLAEPPVDQIHFGVLAVDANSGDTLYARNAHRKFVPASNQKVLVTASALSLLGADYRYETAVWGAGAVDSQGRLDGDLVLLGTGDPSLSDRYHESGEEALRGLADSLHAAGLRSVTGSLVVDASGWDSTTVAGSWMVSNLPWRYSATGGAFAIDEGELRVVVAGGREGEPAETRWRPETSPGFVTPWITTAHTDSSTRIRPFWLPESRRLILEGRVGAGVTDTTSVAIRDPVRQATAVFARILAEEGIRVESGWRVAWKEGELLGAGCRSGAVPGCRGARKLAALSSPPLSELVAGILEPSQNWMTEQLVRTLGAELGEEASWSEGIDVMLGFLEGEVGVDSLDLAPRDGSGLSAYNLVTPRALVAIFRYMGAGPHAQAYRSALAEPGEEDSTLERRLLDLEGRVHAKTGTISNVNSLSGYLVRDDGREVVFSVLSNGSGLPSSTVRSAIDDVVRILAR